MGSGLRAVSTGPRGLWALRKAFRKLLLDPSTLSEDSVRTLRKILRRPNPIKDSLERLLRRLLERFLEDP